MHGSDPDSGHFWVGPAAAPDTYRLVSLIGGGGEGEVWHGVLPLSTGGRRQVAVKVMRTPAAGVPWESFGHLLTSLSHPGLVRVTDVFTGPAMHRAREARGPATIRYVVMDHVAGATLRDWCDENPHATAARRLRMLRTVAAALDEMHSGASTEVAVAHGDVKPANIVVTPEGATVLVDLGLVQLADAAGPSGHSAPYAAPELRVPGALSTPEADRFAFAVTTAQVLIGRPPPTGPDNWLDLDTLERLLATSPATAQRPTLVQRLMETLRAPAEARPRRLGSWLDSAAETLSQVTAGGPVRATAQTVTGTVGPAYPGTGVVGAPSEPAPGAPLHRPQRRGRRLVAVALAVVVLGGGAAAAMLSGVFSPAAAGTDAAGATPSVVPATAAAPSTTSATTTTRRPVPTTTRPGSTTGLDPTETAYLSQQERVDYDRAAVYGYAEDGTFSAGGEQYGRSLQVSSGCGNRDGGDYWVEYDLSQDYSRFTASVGLADTSAADSSVTYRITGDQELLTEGPLSLGQVDQLDLPVTGVLRLRLTVNNPATIRRPCSDNDSSARVVFGDAALVP